MSSPAAREVTRFRHEALLYAGWAEFVAGTVPFIRDGLEAGEPVLVVESAEKIEMLHVALGVRPTSHFRRDAACCSFPQATPSGNSESPDKEALAAAFQLRPTRRFAPAMR